MTCNNCTHDGVCHLQEMSTGLEIEEYIKEFGCEDYISNTDFVEVVRCKDCQYNVANMVKDELDTTDYDGKDIVCSYFMTDGLQPTDFCSYGKRK